MSYGKSALLERRIRALVRETAALLREDVTGDAAGQSASANPGRDMTTNFQARIVGSPAAAAPAQPAASPVQKVKIKQERVNSKAYEIEGYVYFAPNENLLKWVNVNNSEERGETSSYSDSTEEWNKWATKFNNATDDDASRGAGFLATVPPEKAWLAEFRPTAAPAPAPGAPPATGAAPSATKASTALKEIQKLLKLTPDGIWGKQTAAGWEGFITVAKRKVPSLPDGMATNWKGTAPSVNVGSTEGFKPDYTGMLSFMKAVNGIPDPGGSAVDQPTTSSTTASPGATAGEDNIVSRVTTNGPVRQGVPVDITSTYTSNGNRLDINDIVVTVKGTGEVDGVSKVRNPFLPTGRNGKVKVKTDDLAPGTYKATVTGEVLIGGKRTPKSSNVVTFTVVKNS